MIKRNLPNDPALVAQCFVPEQLSRARELKGLTKTALAKLISKTASAITQFEDGTIQPDGKTVASMSLALSMPPQFFARKPFSKKILMEDCHFRSLRSVSQQLRRQSLRIGELVHELVLVLEELGIEFPKEEISELKAQINLEADIESIATQVRRAWGLGDGPIPELIKLVEAKGVIVLPLANVCREVDAFSTWYQGRPFIMLAMQKTSSRTHFDIAHELAHLILHDDAHPGDPFLEKQADDFAASFLLPRETFLAECPSRWNMNTFCALKRRWFVSIRALIYNARKLGRLTEASHRRASIELNSYNSRNEPEEWTLQGPSMLKDALTLVEQELSFNTLAEMLTLHKAHLEEVLSPIMSTERAPVIGN